MYNLKAIVIFLSISFLATFAYGQMVVTDSAVTLKEALLIADKNYPFLKSKQSEVEAAKKEVALSRNTLVPSLEAGYQVNIATYNNITGMYNPVGLVPMTGPASTGNKYDPVFGSAAGFLLNWQAILFGQRTALIEYSKAGVVQKQADQQQELFRHRVNVINTYLDVALTKELIAVFEKNIERVDFLLKQSRTLLTSGLKPGVDTALFQAELSKAKNDLLYARNNFDTQKILLSQLLAGRDAIDIKDSLFFEQLPAEPLSADTSMNKHPFIVYSQSLIDYGKARESLLKHADLPKLGVWSTAYARGSGVSYDGTVKSTDGLGFSRYNYGVGLQLTVPILKFTETRLQTQQQRLLTRSLEEKKEEAVLLLNKQNQTSQANYANALAIVKETNKQFQAAAYAYKAVQIRYNSGLVNFTDLIQTQYNLLKAETDVKQSYWLVWKAFLNKTIVTGDINVFLNEIK